MDRASPKLGKSRYKVKSVLLTAFILAGVSGCDRSSSGESAAETSTLNELAMSNMADELGIIAPPPIVDSFSEGEVSIEEARKPVEIADIGEN